MSDIQKLTDMISKDAKPDMAGKNRIDHKEAVKCLININNELVRLREENNKYRSLLALMCGDGGHYEIEHGTEKAVEYAVDRYIKLREENGNLLNKVCKLQDDLDRLRLKFIKEHRNGCDKNKELEETK
jgi:hypothetical protein